MVKSDSTFQCHSCGRRLPHKGISAGTASGSKDWIRLSSCCNSSAEFLPGAASMLWDKVRPHLEVMVEPWLHVQLAACTEGTSLRRLRVEHATHSRVHQCHCAPAMYKGSLHPQFSTHFQVVSTCSNLVTQIKKERWCNTTSYSMTLEHFISFFYLLPNAAEVMDREKSCEPQLDKVPAPLYKLCSSNRLHSPFSINHY